MPLEEQALNSLSADNRPYTQQQASSYNRASKAKGQPGWFADSDGTGFIRTEMMASRRGLAK